MCKSSPRIFCSRHTDALSSTTSKLQARKLQRKLSSGKRYKQRSSQPHDKPLSVLLRGNSDPFNTSGITITPQINHILTFARDVCLPAFYFVDSLRDSSGASQPNRDVTNSSGWISSPAARLGWQQVVDALSDKCTAMACLSTYLALMAACNINVSSATEASLKMRAGSSALLRQRLIRHNNQTDPDVDAYRELLWQVFWHFYAEFFAGNMAAAQIHGKMLRQSCEDAAEGVITEHFLDSVLFVDANMSTKYMTRPVLDIESWIPNTFSPIWSKIDPHVAAITKEDGSGFHRTVSAEPLHSIFLRIRQSLTLLRQSSESYTVDVDFNTLYYWLNSHGYVDAGLLIDRHLSILEKAATASGPTPMESLGSLYTQSSLCVAALYLIRDVGHEIRINGIDIVDASSTITKHLHESLLQAHTNCTPDEHKEFLPAHLWCAWVGALAEQRQQLTATTEQKAQPGGGFKRQASLQQNSAPFDASSMQFNAHLAELAQALGLLSWQQVSDVLQKFVYTDAAEPHGSRWFWKTMGVYLDRQRTMALRENLTRVKPEEQDSSTAGEVQIVKSDPASSVSRTKQSVEKQDRRKSTAAPPGGRSGRLQSFKKDTDHD